jgi:hypothetical protein
MIACIVFFWISCVLEMVCMDSGARVATMLDSNADPHIVGGNFKAHPRRHESYF